MNRHVINYELVARAAEEIKKKGKEPSLTTVSEELGVYSSGPELSEYLEKWYHTQPEFQRTVNKPLSENIKISTSKILEKNVEMEKSLSLLRATLECTADGIMMVNGKGQVVDWNQKFVEMWRIPSYMLEAGTESISFEYILDQLTNPEGLIADVQYLYENIDWQGELPALNFKDGRIFERYTQPQRVGNEIVGRVYSFRDVTQKRMADDQLRIRERAIEESTHGVVIAVITRDHHPIIYVNKAFERITGFNEKQAVGQSLVQLVGNKTDQVNQKRLELAMRELREETVELESYRRDGQLIWCEVSVAPVRDSFNNVKHFVCIVNDTTQRREMEEQLLRQATHDSLTELPNRVLLLDRVEQAILNAKKKNGMLAFLYLDLDRFKMTNDTLGHSFGDKLLQAVSNRLLVATSDVDTVARLGGDEFVILLQDIHNESQALQMAQEILHMIERPFQIEQHSIKVTGSIGISFYPKDGLDYESLMKNADLSMYHAKDTGRNTCRTFDQEMNRRVINRMQLDSALRDSLKNDEFHLAYQPLIDLKHQRIVGLEALLRWESQLLGNVSPADFIGMAEENGMIIDIGKWVLQEACAQGIKWHQQGYNELHIAVNISGRQFRQTRLPEAVKEILDQTGFPAKCLELELTESLLVEDLEKAVETMHQLKDMGVQLVIDDFGTGYSSLSYLKRFPVDKLKIDRSFISELVNVENDAAIARAIINLGHSLNLHVLAEGVENELQLEFIEKHGCDYAQGYYFKPPNIAEDVEKYIAINYKPRLKEMKSSKKKAKPKGSK